MNLSPAHLFAMILLTSNLVTETGATEPSSDQPKSVERTSYSGENAPPGVRLMMFLGWFRIDLEDRDLIIEQKLVEGGFHAEDFDNLLVYFEGLRERIESEIDREMWQIACHDRASELNGVEIRAVWNAFEDLRHGTYAKYVAVASGELATLGYVDVPEKLEIMETSFGSTGFDYRDSELISDEQLLEARSGICKGLELKQESLLN